MATEATHLPDEDAHRGGPRKLSIHVDRQVWSRSLPLPLRLPASSLPICWCRQSRFVTSALGGRGFGGGAESCACVLLTFPVWRRGKVTAFGDSLSFKARARIFDRLFKAVDEGK